MPPVANQLLQDQIEETNASLTVIKEQNRSLLDLLRGNPNDPDDKGMIGKMKTLETRLGKLEKFKERTIWALYGAGAATGWGLTGLLGKLQEIVSKH